MRRPLAAFLLSCLLLLTGAVATAQEVPEGDLWLFSGQSNMELPVSRCMDAVAEEVSDWFCNDVRYMKVPLCWNFDSSQLSLPQGSLWESLDSPAMAQHWGAICYFVGRYLNEALHRPVAMINSSVGGSPIEAWMPEESLPEYARKQLLECRDSQWMAGTLDFNSRLYSDWQERHNALPYDENTPWRDIEMFSPWGTEDGQNVYGSHFLRISFTLTKAQAQTDAVLRLGAMSDADSTFVNGHFVGNTTYQYPPRIYKVPCEYLREGGNTIEIHLYAANNRAAFVPDKKYCLQTVSGEIPLDKGWQYRPGRRMPRRLDQVFLQYKPSGLYNAMLHPLTVIPGLSSRLKGVVWYQGESNASAPEAYADLLKEMIRAWREAFSRPDLPFYIIELAAFEHSELQNAETSGWVRLQDAQRQVCETEDNVFLVPNRDLGEWNDIHPQDKKTLSERVVKVILNNN